MRTLFNILSLLLFVNCSGQSTRAFIEQYEFEDFSQYKGMNVFTRGKNNVGEQIIAIDVPDDDEGSHLGIYVVAWSETTCNVANMQQLIEHNIAVDTVHLYNLARTFMQYGIAGLNVDLQGNVSVFLPDVETLAYIRFANKEELQKRSREADWINVSSDWYKPARKSHRHKNRR